MFGKKIDSYLENPTWEQEFWEEDAQERWASEADRIRMHVRSVDKMLEDRNNPNKRKKPKWPNIFLPIPDNNYTDMKTKTYYEIHSVRGHVRLTDDKIDVREALNKNLMVVEVQEMTMYLTDSIIKTSVSRHIKTI